MKLRCQLQTSQLLLCLFCAIPPRTGCASVSGGGGSRSRSTTTTFGRRALFGNTVSKCGSSAAALFYLQQDGGAAQAHGDLQSTLASRSASDLKRSTFNSVPRLMEFPEWFEGEWETSVTFQGYQFPPIRGLDRQQVVQDVALAGFQKLSIAQLADVGAERSRYVSRWERIPLGTGRAVVEDRRSNLKQAIDGTLRRDVVEAVDYNLRVSPNRCSIRFRPQSTRNAEQIELFTNARKSQVVGEDRFYCSELLRQVTYSLSQQAGVARQAVTEYQFFWSHRRNPGPSPEEPEDRIHSNLLTAVYFQPQDPLYFKAVDMPVAVYSHNFEHVRRRR